MNIGAPLFRGQCKSVRSSGYTFVRGIAEFIDNIILKWRTDEQKEVYKIMREVVKVASTTGPWNIGKADIRCICPRAQSTADKVAKWSRTELTAQVQDTLEHVENMDVDLDKLYEYV